MDSYYQDSSVVVGPSVMGSDNMAGFGARRFMQDMYQQQDYGHQSQNHYQSNQASTSDSYHGGHAPYHHSSNGYSASQSTSYGYYHSPPRQESNLPSTSSSHYRAPSHASRYPTSRHHEVRYPHGSYAYAHHANEADVDASAANHRPADAGPVWRSDSLDSSATDSTAGLAYARSGDSQFSRNESKPNPSASSSRRQQIPQIRLEDRATVYDDDYEESADGTTVDLAAGPPSIAPVAVGGGDSIDAPFAIVRATVLEPDLPKAKCADCGDKLDFEELASHTCQPSGTSQPLLTIQLPTSSSSSSVSSNPTSPVLTTPRSPFFDRYDTRVTDAGPASPGIFATATHTDTRGGDDEEDLTPKAHAVRIVGTQAIVKASPAKVSSPTIGDAARSCGTISPPVKHLAIQRSASDAQADAAARRKMIEEQRAAKVKDNMTPSMPRAATTSSLVKQSLVADDLTRSASVGAPSGPSRKMNGVAVPAANEGQHAKKDSGSSLSSTASDLSGRFGLSTNGPSSRGGLAANITPSSSYERIEDGIGPASKRSTPTSTPSKPSRERGQVDLSDIEEMMKDLTASPEPLQRKLADGPGKAGQKREVASDASQRARAATTGNKSERERALELELERLRDKERTRQLQAMRLKEKKKRERAAKRCCVCDCSLSSSRTPFVERDGKLLCARDWKELYLPKCRKCNLIVEKGAVKSSDGALRGVFHRGCFSCAACEAPFTDGSFYVYNNQPYCSRHYHRLNGSLCRECETGIEGDCRQTDTGDRFHPQCFSCQYSSKSGSKACLESLADYYVVGGQRLCERHADKMSRRLAKAGQKQLDLRAQKRMTMLHSLR